MFRRTFLQSCGLGAVGLTSVGATAKTLKSANVTPRGSAENVIFIFLQGAPSHVDTFDLKVGSWTPDDFGPATHGNLLLPEGLFPNLCQHTDKFSLLRCITGNEAVHQRASYILETAHGFNPTFAKEQPHFGSLVALEMESRRKADDIFPSFLAMNGQVQGPGMLPSTYAAFSFSANNGVAGLEHPGGEDLFRKRYDSLLKLDANHRFGEAPNGAAVTDYHNFYTLGSGMMYDPDSQEAFTVTEEELARYGDNSTGRGCAIAVKTLAKNRGTRMIQITQGGWDHHYDIYDPTQPTIYAGTAQLDLALASMLQDLQTTPGTRGGTLLDETMVVVTGEFGRTPGNITNNLGRDHYPYAWSALVAGGGAVPNQAMGATDQEGWGIIDPFWSQLRYINMEDLIATMYSSLGIDWTKEIQDTPSGRVFEYTPKVNGVAGYYQDIVEMFG